MTRHASARLGERALSTARPDEPEWNGPQWEDPTLTRLARQLREAHRLVAPLPPDTRRRLIRHLLAITDLAKRDADLAARRLEAFLTEHGADFRSAPGAR